MTGSRVNKNHGFALLYAMLVSSVVLSVGIGILNVTLRQYTLESAARESQYAFYAADSAAECVYYWDARWYRYQLSDSPFATSSDSVYLYGDGPNSIPADTVRCNGVDLKNQLSDSFAVLGNNGSIFATTSFNLSLPDNRSAMIKVGKEFVAPVMTKYLESDGLNVTDPTQPRAELRIIRGPFH